MNKIKSTDIITPELEEGAIYNDEFTGFHQDYLVLHCLIKKYQPKSIFEIGTNMGTGTCILKNAFPEAVVFTLDLPTELAHVSLQHPISENKGDSVGHKCKLPFVQLRGDSTKFDYRLYPSEAYYIDGEHTLENVYKETRSVLPLRPRIIIYHDTDISEVYDGIMLAFLEEKEYDLYRVEDTRISYAIKKI